MLLAGNLAAKRDFGEAYLVFTSGHTRQLKYCYEATKTCSTTSAVTACYHERALHSS